MKIIKILFLITCSWFLVPGFSYADSLNRAEALYLQGSYSESIDECAQSISRNKDVDKSYYLLGLNYLQRSNIDKAREKLKIIIESYASSAYFDSAKLAYADSYFIDQDYTAAKRLYEELVKNNSKSSSGAYLGLARCALKSGDWIAAKQYAEALQQKFPQSLEAGVAKELFKKDDFFFTVQVGSFASFKNAQKLVYKLKGQSFDAYLDELNSGKSPLYRVRVGKLKNRKETEELKLTLEQKGYPTKIFP